MLWTFKTETFDNIPTGVVGFIYVITNTSNNRKYIGKKIFKFSRIRKRKGKRNERLQVESDWQSYTGSSEELNNDIKELGEDKFTKEILYLCTSKSSMNYMEAKTIFLHGALESDNYYNKWLSLRVHKVKNLVPQDPTP